MIKLPIRWLVFISLILFCQCANSYPKAECKEKLNAFNTIATISFGQSCFFSTGYNNPSNSTRCAALAYLNMVCSSKPKEIYKLEVSIDGTKKEARENRREREKIWLALALYNNMVDNVFIDDLGKHVTDLIDYLVVERYAQSPTNGQMKVVNCSESGNVNVNVYNGEEIFLGFNNCRHKTDSIFSEVNVSWSGNMSGFIINISGKNWYSVDGSMEYSGIIKDKTFGERQIQEYCKVDIMYSFSGYYYYRFCGRPIF